MRSRTLLGLTAGAIALTGAIVAPPASAASSITWKSCNDPDAKGVECATINVPLDWKKPNGQQVKIGLARRKATNPSARIGSVLMDPGGPGGSGVDFVKYSEGFTDKVNARFDLVGFDPRGINTSTQIRCDGDLLGQAWELKHPTSQAEFDKLAAVNRKQDASCRKFSGPIVDHVDNLNTVRDMDAIRAALGDKKLTFVGYSYGSLMGQQYAEKYPKNVRALVMDGNMDHSLRTAWDFMRTETAPVERGFRLFAQWCDSTKTCALYGKNTRKVYAELKKLARAGKLKDEEGNPIDFYSLSGLAFNVMFPQAWGEIAKEIDDLRDGKASAALSYAAEPVNDPYPAIWCSDWSYPVRNYAHYKVLRKLLSAKFPNVEWSPYVDHAMTCVGSTTKNTNPQKRLRVKGAPPLLMVGNVHDPATVYEWNKAAARQSGAHLITYEGWGHTAYGPYGPSTCVNDAVDAYLIDLKVPKRGLRCPSTDVPGGGETAARIQRHPVPVGPYSR